MRGPSEFICSLGGLPSSPDWTSVPRSLERVEPFSARFRWNYGDTCLTQAVPNNSDPTKATGWIASVTKYVLESSRLWGWTR